MISEAVATPASVSIASPELARGRHAQFLQSLIERRRVQSLDADIASVKPAMPLIELPRVAEAVRAKLGL